MERSRCAPHKMLLLLIVWPDRLARRPLARLRRTRLADPRMPLNSRANYVVTCKTVASAHFLARRLNMTPYLRSALGYNYMMRAHVVW